jgi:hypothetical protein
MNVVLNTNGVGYWSNTAKAVTIVDMQLGMGTQWEGEADIHGELRVAFDTATWDVDTDGLIYTDRQFIKELREFLDAHGLPGADVDYSEQGMQGDDYVSLDAGTAFYTAWMAKFGIAQKELVEVAAY